jgi:hypothetical protein
VERANKSAILRPVSWARVVMMSGFKAPFRITTIYDRLKKRPELDRCKITIEEMERSDDYVYPRCGYDTAWVWVRWERDEDDRFAMWLAGRVEFGVFWYLASDEAMTPQNGIWKPYDQVDATIDFVVEKFKAFPKGD